METKELIAILKRELGTVKSKNVVDTARDEVIQKLLEADELKRLAFEAADPLIELYNFLINISEKFQEGDIDYGRK